MQKIRTIKEAKKEAERLQKIVKSNNIQEFTIVQQLFDLLMELSKFPEYYDTLNNQKAYMYTIKIFSEKITAIGILIDRYLENPLYFTPKLSKRASFVIILLLLAILWSIISTFLLIFL